MHNAGLSAVRSQKSRCITDDNQYGLTFPSFGSLRQDVGIFWSIRGFAATRKAVVNITSLVHYNSLFYSNTSTSNHICNRYIINSCRIFRRYSSSIQSGSNSIPGNFFFQLHHKLFFFLNEFFLLFLFLFPVLWSNSNNQNEK